MVTVIDVIIRAFNIFQQLLPLIVILLTIIVYKIVIGPPREEWKVRDPLKHALNNLMISDYRGVMCLIIKDLEEIIRSAKVKRNAERVNRARNLLTACMSMVERRISDEEFLDIFFSYLSLIEGDEFESGRDKIHV